jgi:hypothetical protein
MYINMYEQSGRRTHLVNKFAGPEKSLRSRLDLAPFSWRRYAPSRDLQGSLPQELGSLFSRILLVDPDLVRFLFGRGLRVRVLKVLGPKQL